MASRYYCANVAGELEGFSEKLHSLSEKLDRVPSTDKWRLQPHIDELHIIMTELDDRLCEMVTTCSTVEIPGDDVGRPVRGMDPAGPVSRNELFDYDIGG